MVASKPDSSDTKHSPVLTLKKRADFLRLRQGKKVSGQYFTLQAAPTQTEDQPGSIGYTVTTRVGNAVERNRIKRRLREVVRRGLSDRKPARKGRNFDYVLLARRSVLCGDFETLVNEFTRALDRIHANGSKGTRRTD